MSASTSTIRVATLNCRNAVDNWPKRSGLLLDQLTELRPDVIGLQELRHFFPSQAQWIAAHLGFRTGEAHWLHCTYKSGLWWFWEGIGILSRLPLVERDDLILHGDNRVASFARLELPHAGVLDFYNTHLASKGADLRKAQVREVLEWMARRPDTPQVLVGDFNAAPSAASIRYACQTLRSAYREVHGCEPDRTVPTPLRRSKKPARSVVLDYILVNDKLDVHDARVTFDRSLPDHPRLYASDHYGLAATVSVRT